MDYCLDWKPDAGSWSAREIVYHLVDTPPGGLHSLISGILSGRNREFDLIPGRAHLNPERQTLDIDQVRRDILRELDGLEAAVAVANDGELSTLTVLAHLKGREIDGERTPQALLNELFAEHWHRHSVQLRELRANLGI